MIESFANTYETRFTLHHVLSVTNKEKKLSYLVLQPMLFMSVCSYMITIGKNLITHLGASVTALSS